MNTLNQLIRAVLFTLLTVVGMVMALIFMASTALAMLILYVVARLSGRPFEIRSYWKNRRRSPNPAQGYQQRRDNNTASPYINDPKNISDIEMREIN